MRHFFVLVILLVTCGSQSASADYMDYGLDVICNGKKAVIVPYGAEDRDVYSSEPKDCALKSGRIVRAKLGLGPVYPYGMGGSDPDKWISVWIDDAKVLSRLDIGCEEDGPCDTRVIITDSGMSVCSGPSQAPFPSEQPDQKEQKEKCTLTPNKILNKKRDLLEFPRPGDRVPPAEGSFVTVFARDKTFCNQFKTGSTNDWGNRDPGVALPDAASVVETKESLPYGIGGIYSFDINNDGKIETVLGSHFRSHMYDGDVYSVLPGPIPDLPNENDESGVGDLKQYTKGATQILPQHWVSSKTPDSMATDGDYRFKATAFAWWDPDDHPAFEIRYLYMRPFKFSGTTYFLSWSMQAGAQHWVFVLHPLPDYSVEEACIFQFVRTRY